MLGIKQNLGLFLGVALALILTVVYLIFSWHVSTLWLTLVGDPMYTSHLSIFALNPTNGWSSENPVLLWHLLALVSLLTNFIWAFKRVKMSQDNDKILLPLVCHLLWILSCVLLHIGGGLASFVHIGQVIS